MHALRLENTSEFAGAEKNSATKSRLKIDECNIKGWEEKNSQVILIPEKEYDRALNSTKYKWDIEKLLAANGGFYGGRFTIS